MRSDYEGGRPDGDDCGNNLHAERTENIVNRILQSGQRACEADDDDRRTEQRA